jgi:hypothetical protein
MSDAPRFDLDRRELVKLLVGCFAAIGISKRTAAAEPETLEIDRLWERASPEKLVERLYRVDATILLLSVPVLRRNGVGDARVALRQSSPAAEGGAKLALEFAASSDPARAHGLDRMGWIREVVVEKSGAPQRSGVLGIMSDSNEQTAEEARTALRNDVNAERLVAIDAIHSGGEARATRSRVIRFRAPRGNWTGGEGLPNLARESFQSSAAAWKDQQWPGREAAPATFLYALKRAMEAGGSRTAEYIWNQNRYAMRLEREADAAASRELAAPVDRIRGELQNVTQNLRPLRFQIWIDRESPIPMPLRVEFQPRSFLRLTLEARAMEEKPHTPETVNATGKAATFKSGVLEEKRR